MLMFNSGEDERQRLERLKVDRNDADNQYVKQMMSTIERKLEDECLFRMKNEEDTRKYFDSKFISLAEKLKSEEKQSLEREKRLMHQF